MLLAFGIGLVLFQQDSSRVDLAKEPTFQSVVSMDLKLRSVRNVVAELTKDSGGTISIQPSIAELKVAVRVKERTIGWVLDGIADVLDLEWRKERYSYRLIQTPSALAALNQSKKRYQDHIRETCRAWIRQLTESSRYSRKELADQLEQARKDGALAAFERKPGWSDKLQQSISKIQELQLAGQPVNHALGMVAQLHRLALDKSIQTGELFLASSEPLPGAFPLPSEFRDRAGFRVSDEEPRMVVFAVSFGPLGLEYGVHSIFNGLTPVRSMYFQVPPHEMGLPLPKPSERYSTWASTKATVNEKLSNIPLEPAKRFRTGNETELDYAMEAAERSGQDFIGDAFHTMPLPPPPQAKTASEFWNSRAGEQQGPWIRIEEGAILYRHPAPWFHRDLEIPESALSTLSEQIKKPNASILDAAAQFAAPLSRLQRRWIGMYSPFRRGEPLHALMMLGDLLSFWGTLPPAAASAAQRHEVVPFPNLGASGANAFRYMLQDLLVRPRSESGPIPSELFHRVLLGDFASMALLVEPTKKFYSVKEQEGVTVLTPIEEAGPDATIDKSWTDLHFYFGLDAQRSIRITAPVPISKN